MSLDVVQELIIMQEISTRASVVSEAGFIFPCPVRFTDRADYWQFVSPKITQKAIETTDIAFCMLSVLREDDFPAAACEDNPLIKLTVNFYLFREYAAKRRDESDKPDVFTKKILNNYLLFRQAWRDLKTQFNGVQQVLNLPVGYEIYTNSLEQSINADYKATCDIVPTVKGYSVNLQTKVDVLISD